MDRDEIRASLSEHQNYRCAICGCDEDREGRRFAIDHDHDTGLVRGLLCTRCNVGLGYFSDSVEKLSAAIKYLEDVRRDLADLCPECRDSFLDRVVKESLDNEAYFAAPERPAPWHIAKDREDYVRAYYECGTCGHRWWTFYWIGYLASF